MGLCGKQRRGGCLRERSVVREKERLRRQSRNCRFCMAILCNSGSTCGFFSGRRQDSAPSLISNTSSLIFIYQRNVPKGRPSAQRRRGRTLDTAQAVLALATDQRESPNLQCESVIHQIPPGNRQTGHRHRVPSSDTVRGSFDVSLPLKGPTFSGFFTVKTHHLTTSKCAEPTRWNRKADVTRASQTRVTSLEVDRVKSTFLART